MVNFDFKKFKIQVFHPVLLVRGGTSPLKLALKLAGPTIVNFSILLEIIVAIRELQLSSSLKV